MQKSVSFTGVQSTELPSFSGLRTYLRVGMRSGADGTIRNVAYFAMMTGAVNSIRVGGIGCCYLFV